MTRLGKEAAVPMPTDTFMGAEIWSWHQPLAIQDFLGKTVKPIRVAYFCDGHATLRRKPQSSHNAHLRRLRALGRCPEA